MMRSWIVVLAVVIAGCSGSPEAKQDDPDAQVRVDDEHGAIVGVVVDPAIFPVVGADITLTSVAEPQRTTTDAEGRFAFELIPAGVHMLRVEKLNFAPVNHSVQVIAGDGSPDILKVQLDRLFSQEPRMATYDFLGTIECGYALRGIASSTCANDYTRFIPIVGDDPKCPQCQGLLGDNRGHDFEIGDGWQTLILEMTWKPSAQGTSERMKLILSHTPRPATHWYAAGASPDPLLLRVEQGVVHEDQQDEPELIPSEGLPNAHFFAATDPADGDQTSVAVSQSFEVYYSIFYYGKPPEEWSFIGGDEDPFQN